MEEILNRFNQREFEEICNKLKVEPHIEEVTISYKRSSFFNRMKNLIQSDRRGEVVFGVIRPNGKIIAVRSKEYPDGIFRIPTGGIGQNEDIIDAVFRETKEELGLETEILKFAGVLKIKLQYENDSVMFYSYIFMLKETGGRLLEDASDDEISEVREVDINELQYIVDKLANIDGSWNDWGKLRHQSSSAVLMCLKSAYM